MKALPGFALLLAAAAVLAAPHGDSHGHGKHHHSKKTIDTLKRMHGDRYEQIRDKLQKLNELDRVKKIRRKNVNLKNKWKAARGRKDDSIPQINDKLGIREYLYQGDLVLTEKQIDRLHNDDARSKRQVRVGATLWTDGIVYYELDKNLTTDGAKSILMDMAYISASTCITFVNTTTVPSRLVIIQADGCWSYLGMPDNGKIQELSMGPGCGWSGIAAHELMHALGFSHTHARDDRDNYVNIDLKYVSTTHLLEYEYGSVMHYDAIGFASGGNISMDAKDDRYEYTMGSLFVSFNDLYGINKHYCPNQCSGSDDSKCQNGGLANPKDCSTCYCPSGYAGDFCDQLPANGTKVTAAADWKNFTITVDTTGPDRKIHRIANNIDDNEDGGYGCNPRGVEPKVLADQRVVNPRFCSGPTDTLTSQLNPTPVIAYNRESSKFKARIGYRYVGEPCTE